MSGSVAVSKRLPLIDAMLASRGVTSPEAVDEFFNATYEDHLHDPKLLNDMEKAVERILVAIDNDEHIVIYSDYDCDGIPGSVVAHDFFKAIGYKNISSYIPHRHYEGFGFSQSALDTIRERGARLIITIDCGTSDHEAVAAAAIHGIDVIITDHHEPKDTLPAAVAVVNPKVGGIYPFPHLCGAAVLFKLTQALIATKRFSLTPGQEKWWLDMVGLATIADMVPLIGENRVFARYGLLVLQKSRRPGLRHLLHSQRTNQAKLTEEDIGFTIGPRINAASRMDAPEDALRLLVTDDEAEAAEAVRHLEKLNNERKGVVAAMTREAHGRMKGRKVPTVIVLGNPEWRPSLVGLVANKLAEEYDRPTFIWGRDGNGVLKGSARSNGTVSVIALMEADPSPFSEYGGHHFSGGFSLTSEGVHRLGEVLKKSHSTQSVITVPTRVSDATLQLTDLTSHFIDAVLSLAPFGEGNPKPRFVLPEVIPHSVIAFGKGNEHTRLVFKTPAGEIEAVSFFTPPERYGLDVSAPKAFTLTAELERSTFLGTQKPRLRIVAIE